MAGRRKDISGQRFGKLVAIERFYNKDNKVTYWKCKCDCGNECKIILASLLRKTTTSCGCYNKNKNKTHGMTNSIEYNSYIQMKNRCLNINANNYNNYGSRGITICNEWLESFENFYNDMGIRPSKNYSLDRIDVNGNYELNNCRWANKLTQSRNTRSNIKIINTQTNKVYNSISEAAEYENLNYSTLSSKLRSKKQNKFKRI